MNNPEFILLRNRFLIALLIALIFTVPLTFLFINKFGNKPTKLMQSINNKENIFVLVTENNCNNCQKIENILEKSSLNFFTINKDTEEQYSKFIQKIKLPKSEIKSPTLIYLEDGIISSKLVDPTQDETQEFLTFYGSK